MRISGLLFMIIALIAATASAQQEVAPSTDNGPLLNIKSAPPQPDKDGVYAAGPGIQSPIFLHRVAAVYPSDASAGTIAGIALLSVVIGSDGIPSSIQVVNSKGPAFEAAAIEAVKKSQYAPGTMNDKPIPMRVYLLIRFFPDQRPAYPVIRTRETLDGFPQRLNQRDAAGNLLYDKPPVLIKGAEAEFSDEARRGGFQGNVILSLLVTEQGLPTDILIEKSLGHGLDEKAIESVQKYRFKPATKDGKPVPARISIEVSFRLYSNGSTGFDR